MSGSTRRPLTANRVKTAVLAATVVCCSLTGAFAQGQGALAAKKLATKSQPSATKVSMRNRATAAAATPSKPTLVGTFGDWGTYVSQGAKSKVCYALGQPKARIPASLKRDAAYIFISNRPGEGVRNEVSIIMGVPLKDGATGAKADVGSTGFELVAKGQNAFVKNAAEEGKFVDTLKKRGSKLTIKIPSAKSGDVTDTYSIAGLAQALDRVAKECP